MKGRQPMARCMYPPCGSSLALLRSTRPARLPTAGKLRPFGEMGGSHLPSRVIVPVRGVEVGRGVRVLIGSRGVRVGVIGVASAAILVSSRLTIGGGGVE